MIERAVMLTSAPEPNNHGNPRSFLPTAPASARVRDHARASVTIL
jgi:hypothetical protein